MNRLLLVGVGGFLGSIGRYAVQYWIQKIGNGAFVPYTTLLINVLGCGAIGYFGGLAEFRGLFSTEIRIFLFMGILGGFTTYSAFGYETVKLIRYGEAGFAALNVLLHVTVGLGSVWLGFILAKR